MKNLFTIYAGLYPGKEDVILDAIRRGETEAGNMGLAGKDFQDYVESEILDVL